MPWPLFVLGAALAVAHPTTAAEPSAECRNGEFQFSATFSNRGVDGHPAHPVTAYLWIPPDCGKVRGLILTQQNVGEQTFTEHPAIREACARNGLAILWCCPAIDIRFEKDRKAAVQVLEDGLRQLAEVSGYSEIGSAPWITFGHSTTATFARTLAEARLDRTLAIISAKGGIMLPVVGSVPGVYSGGHFPEWRQTSADWTKQGRSLPALERIRDGLKARWRPVSYVEEFGGGHFDYTDRYLEFLALYIDKVMRYRLNADGSIRAIRPDEGFVVDMRPPLPTAPLRILPLKEATGDQRSAPWFFDRELAEAAVALMDDGHWERKNQIVAFAKADGTPAEFSKSGIADPVPCEIATDGVTVTHLETTFLDELPGNFAQAGMKLTHAATGPRTIERISGVFVADGGKYRIELNRGYPAIPNFIAVRHAGDATHRPTVQPARFVPPVFTGRAQKITFGRIGDQTAGVARVALHAESDAGLKVRFFVRSGPAKMVGDELVFLPVPPRTRWPVKITVVAWQLGRGGANPVAAAEMAEQTFWLKARLGAKAQP
ncbi:hypothetical protein K0B96_14885 [Horticoccus luteus]|uniref:Alpha/beta hydrolase family protein n=1 Tax=Horticoccus luteus TaxID=2862869 RepID=A0A8F9TUK8_9BACT|nr:hypothetical protein [Horticoccus luteus]QYM78568.1 hypothetical protein K0B96_14885 [Horticoccus luteus]